MNHAVFNTPGHAEDVQALDDSDAGMPYRCTLQSPGFHAPIHPTEPGPGWALHLFDVMKHPTHPTRKAYPSTPDLATRLAGRIPEQALQAIMNAGPLGNDWFPEPVPEKEIKRG